MDTSAHSGILLVDKPSGITSHDVVSRTRKRAGTRRVGHAGTLDPMATGLLLLGINGATRLLTYLVGLDKEYWATIRLGGSTSTDDAESPIDVRADSDLIDAVTDQKIMDAIRPLTGNILQVPSTVSAIKVGGKRAYVRARAGETVELKPRAVTVSVFEVLAVQRAEFVDVDVRIECSTGTYVRALARDLGAALGIGGHLTALRRTRVGPFSVTHASTLDELDVATALLPPAQVARTLFPVLDLSAQQAVDLSQGKRLSLGAEIQGTFGATTAAPVAAIAPDGRLVGLVRIEGLTATTLINFPEEGAQ